MGTESIPTRANAQAIDETWFNIFKLAICQAFVPRNVDGVVVDVGGGLGSLLYRWGASYITSICIGDPVAGLIIDQAAGGFRFKVGADNYLDFNSTGISMTIGGVTTFKARATGTHGISSSSGVANTSLIAFSDITNLSVSLTGLTGRPVDICLIPDSAATPTAGVVGIQASGLGAGADANAVSIFRLLRDGTEIGRHVIQLGGKASSGGSAYLLVPSKSISFIDYAPSNSSHTYKLQFNSQTSTGTICYNHRLFAMER